MSASQTRGLVVIKGYLGQWAIVVNSSGLCKRADNATWVSGLDQQEMH